MNVIHFYLLIEEDKKALYFMELYRNTMGYYAKKTQAEKNAELIHKAETALKCLQSKIGGIMEGTDLKDKTLSLSFTLPDGYEVLFSYPLNDSARS